MPGRRCPSSRNRRSVFPEVRSCCAHSCVFRVNVMARLIQIHLLARAMVFKCRITGWSSGSCLRSFLKERREGLVSSASAKVRRSSSVLPRSESETTSRSLKTMLTPLIWNLLGSFLRKRLACGIAQHQVAGVRAGLINRHPRAEDGYDTRNRTWWAVRGLSGDAATHLVSLIRSEQTGLVKSCRDGSGAPPLIQ
jgi:hypothetical protein